MLLNHNNNGDTIPPFHVSDNNATYNRSKNTNIVNNSNTNRQYGPHKQDAVEEGEFENKIMKEDHDKDDDFNYSNADDADSYDEVGIITINNSNATAISNKPNNISGDVTIGKALEFYNQQGESLESLVSLSCQLKEMSMLD